MSFFCLPCWNSNWHYGNASVLLVWPRLEVVLARNESSQIISLHTFIMHTCQGVRDKTVLAPQLGSFALVACQIYCWQIEYWWIGGLNSSPHTFSDSYVKFLFPFFQEERVVNSWNRRERHEVLFSIKCYLIVSSAPVELMPEAVWNFCCLSRTQAAWLVLWCRSNEGLMAVRSWAPRGFFIFFTS